MGRQVLTLFVALAMVLLSVPLGSAPANAAGVISFTGATYTQNFDTLASTGTSSLTPEGWAFVESGTNANTLYNSGAGTNNAGDTYSFGAAGSAERAFGGLLSGSLVPTVGAQFVNNSGAMIARLTVAYTGEQWRLGTSGRGSDRLDFQYSLDASSLTTGTWLDVDSLDFSGPTTSGTVGALDGNAAANRVAIAATIQNLSIAVGATFWIRWTDFNASGADDGMAIDEFSIGPGDLAPAVASTAPTNGATGVSVDANLSVTFSEPVTTADPWYSITCTISGAHSANASGGPTTFTLDPSTEFTASESCTVTIVAANVADKDTQDPPDTMAANFVWSFTIAEAFNCTDPKTPIHVVQGSGPASPINGAAVTIQGVVVGSYQSTVNQFSGFYLEEAPTDWDADPATSEGIFVFATTPTVNPGDVVRVNGRVTEFGDLTEIASVSRAAVCSTGGPLAPTTITLPVAAYTDFERYEGMLVRFDQTLTATETFTLARFGEVRLAADGRLYTPTAVTTPGPPAVALEDENQRRSFVLDDGNSQQNIDPTRYPTGGLSASNTLRSGYTTTGLTGVFDYRFGVYRVQPVGPILFTTANPRTSSPDPVGGNTRVASFNVLNYFNGNGSGVDGAPGGFPTSRGATTLNELQRQTAKEVSALIALNPDIAGLMEIENDAGTASALAQLVAFLNNSAGAGTYAYIDTGVIGTDEIKVALIYKPAVVTPVGQWQIITSATDPRFIDTRNRPSLAQTFLRNGTAEKVTVVVNHLKSKGSACDGDPDTGDGQGNCNVTRTQAAAALVDWLATDPTASGSPNFLLIGDMNSYTFEDPITRFTDGGFLNLVQEFDGPTAYSYVFNGESGYLDHALASPQLAANTSGVTHWHINADEPVALDYNTEFKTANQVTTFYAPTAYRSSDHDPVVIGLDLVTAPPTFTVTPADVTVLTGAGATACSALISNAALGTAEATSGAPGAVTITRSPSGNVFPVGTTTITYTATDTLGRTATTTQRVTVIDNTVPTVVAPANVVRGATGTSTLITDAELGTPTAADNCPGVTVVRTGVPAGNLFPHGTTTITYTATDTSGNTATATQTVTVNATTASVCATVRSYIANAGIANSLCAKLDAAAAARARGNVNAHDNVIDAFAREVNAQRGKALTDVQADALISLAGGI